MFFKRHPATPATAAESKDCFIVLKSIAVVCLLNLLVFSSQRPLPNAFFSCWCKPSEAVKVLLSSSLRESHTSGTGQVLLCSVCLVLNPHSRIRQWVSSSPLTGPVTGCAWPWWHSRKGKKNICGAKVGWEKVCTHGNTWNPKATRRGFKGESDGLISNLEHREQQKTPFWGDDLKGLVLSWVVVNLVRSTAAQSWV